ncbi:hypothetical protein EZV62_007335 [Acer yangbiense]|uniref:Rx N-terminal domain-containing protein n=1 Tax=Acer yangbiense TaxID=1000413 RepID=A0A5C7I9T2_9ROSI|nr:hypothetical protein EZV62_007335 [Acer yangbiense]
MASSNSSSQPNACENLMIQGLIETISKLHNILSEAKLFFPAASIQENHQNVNQGDDKEKDKGDSSKRDLGNCFQLCDDLAGLMDKTRKEKSSIKEEEKNDSDCFQEIDTPEKICNDLNYMKSALTKLKVFEDGLGKPIETLKCSIENILQTHESNGSIRTEQIQPKLREIRKQIFKLKIRISSLHIISSTKSDANRYLPTSIGSNPYNATDDLPNLHMEKEKENQFTQSSYFEEFQVMFGKLDIKSKLCLLCFAVFPEDAVIKKRLLVHWWIGERLLDEEKTVEDSAHKILEDFVMNGFIKPVNRKYRKVANSFKMHTFVRSAVIMLAKEDGFFDYDPEGNPSSNFLSSDRACLVNAQLLETEKLDKLKTEKLDKLKTLFNVSNQFPDFTLEWFSKMRRLRVLYLGRWQSSGKHRHIEVESTEFLKGLKYMEDLRLLSLHGISGIRELPSSISKLKRLRILDLRACYNLENLPKQVGSLKMLTNLDISECYLLDYMPKELLSLSELQVLKGFVITDAKHGSFCTLADLAGLEKLQKLSINVNSVAFSLEEIFTTLQKFEALLKLQVAWGGESLQAKPEARNKGNEGDIKKKEKSAVKSTNQEKIREGQEQDDGATFLTEVESKSE